MSEQPYFKQALTSMSAGAAYEDAVRHLYDRGLSEEEIGKNLTYPASAGQIHDVIVRYEAEKNSPDADFVYEQHTDAYGRKSFIKVLRSRKPQEEQERHPDKKS